MKKVLVAFLALLMLVSLCGCGAKTLDDLTAAKKGGGPLFYEKDEYTIINVYFYGENSTDGKQNCCVVKTNYYIKADYSPSGKVFDRCEEVEYPCTFTDTSLTLNGVDNYTYSVEKVGEREYVVFSKPFLGVTRWLINK